MKKFIQCKQEHHQQDIGVDDFEIEPKRKFPFIGSEDSGCFPNQPEPCGK
jgi:hypothetical protein